MKTALAERLLADIMHWTPEKIAKERPKIQAISNIKYDEYQQFGPGTKFIQSLVLWLRQFDTIEEKRLAYDFIMNNLIFISNSELVHLVDITFPDFVRRILIDRASQKINVGKYNIHKIINSPIYKKTLRQTLFLGLSDGSRIDYFRRINTSLSNEQVYQTYQPHEEKIQDMLKHLKIDLNKVFSITDDSEFVFKTVFLIDDFTASGKSYIRKKDKGAFDGKIPKILQNLLNRSDGATLVDANDFELHIIFYFASYNSLNYIEKEVNAWKKSSNKKFNFSVNAILKIDDSCITTIFKNPDLENLLKKYFDDGIINKHYNVGKTEKPYLGFNECGLSVILNHNTPNNSLPILWFEVDRKYSGLFPRINRHKSE